MNNGLKKRFRSTLLALQHYTKTDMIYLTRSGFWTVLHYSIQVAGGVIIAIGFANWLPKETFGTYQFILSVASVISVMTLSGMKKAVIRAVAQGNDGVYRSSVREKLKWNVGIVVISGAVASYYFFNGNTELGIAFLIVGAFAPLIEGFRLYQAFLIGKEAFSDLVTLGAWRKPLPLIALLLTIYFTNDVLLILFVYFASNAITLVALHYLVLRKHRPPIVHDAETLRYSKHLSVMNIATTVTNNLDKILLWYFLGAASVATFTIAQLATRYSGGALNTIAQQVLPRVSKRDLPTLQQTLPRKVRLFTLVMAVGALGYILVVPILFPLLFPEYPESIPLAQVLALGLLLMPRNVYTQALTAHKLIHAQYIVGLCIPFIKLALLCALLPLYGIWGAVYAALTTRLLSGISTTYFFAAAKTPAASIANTKPRDTMHDND